MSYLDEIKRLNQYLDECVRGKRIYEDYNLALDNLSSANNRIAALETALTSQTQQLAAKDAYIRDLQALVPERTLLRYSLASRR
jgi:hypothetical protein